MQKKIGHIEWKMVELYGLEGDMEEKNGGEQEEGEGCLESCFLSLTQ